MKKFLGEKYFKISIAVVVTIALSYVAILLINQIGPVFNALFSVVTFIINVVAPLILGLVLAYLLLPIVNFFEKLLGKVPVLSKKKGLCRGMSVFLMFFVIFVVIFALLSLIVSTFTSNIHFATPEELKDMLVYVGNQSINFYETLRKSLSKYDIIIPSFDAGVADFKASLSSMGGKKGTSMAASLGTGILGAVNIVKNTVVTTFFAIIFSIYFLSGTEKMAEYWKRAFKTLLGEKIYGICSIILSDLDKCFAGYIRGQLADAVFMAAIVSVSFGIAGIPYAALTGVATGLGNLIPYVGPIIAYGMTIVSCLITGKYKLMVLGIILVFIIQTIDGNIVNPKLLSNSIDVHPALVIVALLFGGAIGGLLGMLLAVPVAAFIRIQFEKLIAYLESKKEEKTEKL